VVHVVVGDELVERVEVAVVAGGSGEGSPGRLATALAMLLGAVAGALLLKASLFAPLALAAVLALATWLVYVPAAVRLTGTAQ
jgi:hypothetical protein